MFSPGETVVHEFTIPFIASELEKVIVSYKQGDDLVFEIPVTSGFTQLPENAGVKFSVFLSQKQSLTFLEMKNYKIQLNVLTVNGTRATSKEIEGRNGAQYHKEVIAP